MNSWLPCQILCHSQKQGEERTNFPIRPFLATFYIQKACHIFDSVARWQDSIGVVRQPFPPLCQVISFCEQAGLPFRLLPYFYAPTRSESL